MNLKELIESPEFKAIQPNDQHRKAIADLIERVIAGPEASGYTNLELERLEKSMAPCPFCGSPGQLCKRPTRLPLQPPYTWNAGCSDQSCIAYRPPRWLFDPAKVIADWNKRAHGEATRFALNHLDYVLRQKDFMLCESMARLDLTMEQAKTRLEMHEHIEYPLEKSYCVVWDTVNQCEVSYRYYWRRMDAFVPEPK